MNQRLLAAMVVAFCVPAAAQDRVTEGTEEASTGFVAPAVRRGVVAPDTLSAPATPASQPEGEAAQTVAKWIAANVRPAQSAATVPVPDLVSDASVDRALPGCTFYVVRFRQWPVARQTPHPLASNNLFVVRQDSNVVHLTDSKGLESFFLAALPRLPTAKTEEAVKDAVRAWLRLSQEFAQDGMFRFIIPPDALTAKQTADGWEGSGKAAVEPQGGNQGGIAATMIFDANGKLTAVQESVNLKAGMRPICQSTKLLDPEPLVRRMAEQDLMVMGLAAREYLAEQRAIASAELRAAIDRVWERIVAQERRLSDLP